MRADPALAGGAALILVVATPPLSPLLEVRLPSHILGQYLLIVAGGAGIGSWLARRHRVDWSAAPALLTAMLTLGFWMLPRWVDASLTSPAANAAKVGCLALLAGVPLGWGWRQADIALRGFLIANGVSMLVVMGWLLLVVPERLCNAYLVSDQRMLGTGLLILAAGLTAVTFVRAVIGAGPTDLGRRPLVPLRHLATVAPTRLKPRH